MRQPLVQVFGISSDPCKNKEFTSTTGCSSTSLTDANSILRKEFGVKPAMFVLPGRQTYVNGAKESRYDPNDMLDTDKAISEAMRSEPVIALAEKQTTRR
jgi:peroxiredoxin